MELVKPEPLIIGGKAHYTLTSYEPVSVTVNVPHVTDFEVDMSLGKLFAEAGGGPDKLTDTAWIRNHFGVADAQELRSALRSEIAAYTSQMVEEEKTLLCVAELAKRLVQRVPDSTVTQIRDSMRADLSAQLAHDGVSESEIFAQFAAQTDQIEAMFDERAKEMAEQDAALDAWVEHQKLQLDDEEIPVLLGIPDDQAESFMNDLRASSRKEMARESALRIKAMNTIAAEASCAYHHETPEEAQKRVTQMMQQSMGAAPRTAPEPPEESSPRLKLV